MAMLPFAGIEAAISAALGLHPGEKARKNDWLTAGRSADIAMRLSKEVFAAIERDLAAIAINRLRAKPPSSSNWRLHAMNLHLSPENYSLEILLERRFVKACDQARRRDWWNQVPVASGLVNSSADKRSAIDLVHERGPNAYDFVELKVGSNAPADAAVQILGYGFLWLLSRAYRSKLGYDARRSLLDADDIALCVLAPAPFYGTANLTNFQRAINQVLAEIAAPHGVAFSFRFEQLPDDFRPQLDAIQSYDPQELLRFFDQRSPLPID